MLLSVIIPAYEHLEEVMVCLTSLQTFASRQVQIEFIVSDDASSSVYLPGCIPACAARTVRTPENVGFAGNINHGASFAHGDILFFVNQDVFAAGEGALHEPLSQNWDVALMQAFDDPDVGIVGARLLFPPNERGEICIQNAGGSYDGHCQPIHRFIGYSQYWLEEYSTPECVSWTTGAALAIRRELFQQVGGMDTSYIKGYAEDVELCCRVAELGKKIWYEPRCTLIHRTGTSGGNPEYFHKNLMLWHSRWVATKKVKPDTSVVSPLGWW